MRRRFKHVKLGDIVIKNGLQTGPFGSQLKAEEFVSKGIPVVMPKNIKQGFISCENIVRISPYKAELLKKHKIISGDIIFSRRGDLKKIGIATSYNNDWFCGTGCLRARVHKNIDSSFLHQYVQIESVGNWLEKNALGQTMLNLNTKIISNLPVLLPPLAEQKAIAELLSTWDKAIETTEKLITAKEEKFKWLLNKMICENNEKIKYKKVIFGELIKERNDRSKMQDQYPVLTSSRRGLFYQSDYFKKQVASKNNSGYKIVCNGDFTYRAMSDDKKFTFNRLNFCDKGIISPAYGVFNPVAIESNFLLYYLNSSIFHRKIIKEIQGGTRVSFKLSTMKKMVVPVPPLEEQKKIAGVLTTAKKEIELLKELADKYKIQKRGLMQKLLTGTWRIKPEIINQHK